MFSSKCILVLVRDPLGWPLSLPRKPNAIEKHIRPLLICWKREAKTFASLEKNLNFHNSLVMTDYIFAAASFIILNSRPRLAQFLCNDTNFCTQIVHLLHRPFLIQYIFLHIFLSTIFLVSIGRVCQEGFH